LAINRIDKVNSLLEHEIGAIIQREVHFADGALVTLTHVEATSNLIEAKVFISCLPEDKIDSVLKTLNNEVFDIQQKINKKLNMRPIPKIRFVKDITEAKAGRIEELLSQEQDRLKNSEK
jgi:ribosome-binding factor A